VKRKTVVITLSLSIILVFVGYVAARLLHQSEAVSFTATYVERLTDSTGNIKEHRHIVAVKPGTSVRVNISTKPDGSECRARIVRTASATTLVVDELMARSTMYHPLPQSSSGSSPTASAQNRYRSGGTARCFGFDADILIAEDRVAKVERWIIPQLNNLMAKDLRYWKDISGVIVSTTEQTLTDLVVAPPDPLLFEVPAHYREMMPSEIETVLFRDVLQLAQPNLDPEILRKSDDMYLRSQKYKRDH
jgi:hypothetical protein